jgi:hypothetical protein
MPLDFIKLQKYNSTIRNDTMFHIYRVGHKSLDTSNLPLHAFLSSDLWPTLYIIFIRISKDFLGAFLNIQKFAGTI